MNTNLVQEIVCPGKAIWMGYTTDLPFMPVGGIGMTVGGDSKIVSMVSYSVDDNVLAVIFDPIKVSAEEIYTEVIEDHISRNWKVLKLIAM